MLEKFVCKNVPRGAFFTYRLLSANVVANNRLDDAPLDPAFPPYPDDQRNADEWQDQVVGGVGFGVAVENAKRF